MDMKHKKAFVTCLMEGRTVKTSNDLDSMSFALSTISQFLIIFRISFVFFMENQLSMVLLLSQHL